MTVSIIGGLGALDRRAGAGARQARRASSSLLLWALALADGVPLPADVPAPRERVVLQHDADPGTREPFDFLNLYIPTNPFNSLANNVVPAVVLFSVIVGAALIGDPGQGAAARRARRRQRRAVSKATQLRRGADAVSACSRLPPSSPERWSLDEL